VIQYRNDEKGMRQDFIVKRKPDGNGDLRLWLYAEMQGGTVSTTAEQISFLTESGAEAMRYSDLKVWDANQKRLKARFEKVGNQVAIVVSDRKAMYPITIDPLSTTPNWTAESNQASAYFGFSVASAGDVNGDGFSDVIVGAYGFDNGETDEGRAFVYHGSGTSFVTQTVNADGIYTFGTTGVSINFTGVFGTGTCKVVRYDTPASNRAFAGTPPTFVSKYRFVIKATGFSFTNAELRFNRTQIPNAGIGNAGTVSVYRRPTPGTGAFSILPNAFNASFPDEVRATTTAFSEFLLGSNDPDNPLPVELVSFRGTATAQGVQLTWQTASEQNNAGFEVRRKTAGEDFVTIASYRFDPSLRGKGTTSSTTTYSFVDATVEAGKTYTYRLRSVDYDGTIHDYAQTVSVEVREPVQARVYEYALEQNYPNPFNPTTTIRYSLKETGKVSVRVYDVMGREVKVLVDGVQGAGEYSVVMDATGLSSGVYVYQLRAGGLLLTRKMVLAK